MSKNVEQVIFMLRGAPRGMGVFYEVVKLLSKDKIDTCFNLFEKVAGQDADTICQKMFVDGDNLRDICYRIVGKACVSLRQHDIPRSLSQTEITRDDDNDDR